MKRIITLLLALAMCLSLAACGGSSDTSTDTPPATDGTTAAADETATPDTEETATPEDVDNEEVQPESENTKTVDQLDSEAQIVFDGITVVDNGECSISITEIDPNNMWGYTLKANLENKSDEKTYMFSVSSAAVNGVQCDPLFASEVAAGKKSIESISFSDLFLDEYDIDFTDIELTFRVYDSDDWTSDDVATETIRIYPYGEDNAETFERVPQGTDNILVDNEYATVTVIGYEEDDLWGYTIKLFLQNKADTEIMFSVEEASVNGYMADPCWAESVLPGKCAFSSMSWGDATLEENGISAIEEIEFVLRAYDYEDWLADDFVNEQISLVP